MQKLYSANNSKRIAPVATGAALIGMALYPQRPLHAEAPDVRSSV